MSTRQHHDNDGKYLHARTTTGCLDHLATGCGKSIVKHMACPRMLCLSTDGGRAPGFRRHPRSHSHHTLDHGGPERPSHVLAGLDPPSASGPCRSGAGPSKSHPCSVWVSIDDNLLTLSRISLGLKCSKQDSLGKAAPILQLPRDFSRDLVGLLGILRGKQHRSPVSEAASA